MADNLTPKEEFLLNPVEEHNITDAAIASFETNFKHPVKVIVPITPVQDLHGYDRPWPAGGSVNLIPDGTDTENGYVAENYLLYNNSMHSGSTNWYVSEYFRIDPTLTYTWSSRSAAENPAICFYDSEKTYISGIAFNNELVHVITPPENAVYARSSQVTYAYQDANPTGQRIQLEVGSTATEYIRHSNICPIEGLTDAFVAHTDSAKFVSKNGSGLVQGYITDYNGKNTAGTSIVRENAYIPVEPNTTYYIVSDIGRIRAFEYSGNTPEYFISATAWVNGSVLTLATQSNTHYIRFQCGKYPGAATVPSDVNYIGVYKNIIPISWKHAEGTYNFEPIQAGEGDPSPDNVRPISPALTLTRDDNSVLTVYGGSITFRDDGTSALTSTWIYAHPDWTKASGLTAFDRDNRISTYAYMGNHQYEGLPNMKSYQSLLSDTCVRYNNDTAANTANVDLAMTTTNGTFIYFSVKKELLPDTTIGSLLAYLTELNPCICYECIDSASTTYVLSKAETQRVIEALGDKVTTTVYGGTVTLNEDGSTDLVSEYGVIDLSSVSWGYSTAQKRFYKSGYSDYDFGTAQTSEPNFLCNAYAPTKWTSHVPGSGPDLTCGGSSGYISIRDLRYDDTSVSAFKSYLAEIGAVFVAILATPITYHFPNVGQLKAFLGTNNIWSDIGNVNVKYLTQNSATGLEYRGDRALELRRRAMMADAPTIHTTVGSEETGGLASFRSYIKAPVKKIEIPFSPKQDLHGYDHPWPAGGGKNLIPGFDNTTFWNTNGFIRSNGTITSSDTYRTSDYLTITPNSTYAYVSHGSDTGRQWRGVLAYDSEKSPIESSFRELQGADLIFTTPENAAYLRLYSKIGEGFYAQLELGSTATAYEPYENICPIEGRDRCKILNNGHGLPPEYQEVEYLESTGTQYIDTGYIPSKNMCFDVTFSATTNSWHIMGLRSGGTSAQNRIFIATYNSSSGRVAFGVINASADIRFNSVWTLDNIVHVVFNDTNELLVNDVKTSNAFNRDNYVKANNNTYYLFRINGYTDAAFANARIYNAKFSELGIDIREFIPCYRKSDSKPGMYDLISKTFFTNAGTGEFIIGPDVLNSNLSLTFNQSGDHSFTPIQEGTGDPSPENVRPIHPGLTITRDDDSVLSVYGGTLTVNADGTGSLIDEWGLETVMPETLSVNSKGSSGYWILCSQVTNVIKKSGVAGYTDYVLSNLFKRGNYGREVAYTISQFAGGGVAFVFPVSEFSNIDEIRTWATSNPITIAFILAEPIAYTLSVAETNRALEALGLTQHIGPIYGGTVTINPDGSADVVSEYGIFTADGSNDEQWMYTSGVGGGSFIWQNTGAQASYYYDDPRSVCNNLKKVKLTDGIFGALIGTTAANNELWILCATSTLGIDNVTSFREWLAVNQVSFTAKLATPQTYHFSNLEQLKVWLGENNFWCDISDDITVKYWNRG